MNRKTLYWQSYLIRIPIVLLLGLSIPGKIGTKLNPRRLHNFAINLIKFSLCDYFVGK